MVYISLVDNSNSCAAFSCSRAIKVLASTRPARRDDVNPLSMKLVDSNSRPEVLRHLTNVSRVLVA